LRVIDRTLYAESIGMLVRRFGGYLLSEGWSLFLIKYYETSLNGYMSPKGSSELKAMKNRNTELNEDFQAIYTLEGLLQILHPIIAW